MRVPKLCRHRASGLAYVTDPRTGKEEYLGPYGSAEAVANYDRWVKGYLAGDAPAPPRQRKSATTLGELGTLYLPVARLRYQKRGQPTAGYPRVKRVLGHVLDCGLASLPLDELAPRHLRVLARHLASLGKCARTIDAYLCSLRVMVRWAAEQEPPYLDEDIADRLDAARGLGKKAGGKVRPPVLPPPPGAVEQVLPALPLAARAIVELLRASGMRPGEASTLRVRDIDDSQTPWAATVCADWNKNAHRGKRRVVYLGPRARAVLTPWLEKARRHGPSAPVFPTQPGKRGRGHYTSHTLKEMVSRACARTGAAHWSPGQLRHEAGTAIRAAEGMEAAQAILGHDNASTTAIYALPDAELARRTAEQWG